MVWSWQEEGKTVDLTAGQTVIKELSDKEKKEELNRETDKQKNPKE